MTAIPNTDLDTRKIRTLLRSERAEILRGLSARSGERPSGPSGVSDGWGETEHLAVAEQAGISQRLDRLATTSLEQIEAAIRRIDEGTYGTCAHCAEPIAAERLEALPAASHCLGCQHLLEVHR